MKKAATTASEAALTEYELQRLAHVRRNEEQMIRLGVKIASAFLQPPAPKIGAKRRREPRERVEPSRRSARLQNEPAAHDGHEVELEEEADEEAAVTTKLSNAAAARRLLENSREWLESARAAMAQSLMPPGAADEEWRAEAVRRWGERVPAALPSGASWHDYVSSRQTSPPPPSDLELIQELYAHDAWSLLAACVLMSRVSSQSTKSTALAAFFALAPTPSALLDAEASSLQAAMHPLGLFDNRLKALIAVSERFLTAPRFDVGSEPANKIWGCGAFTISSFAIFVKGQLDGPAPDDATLKAFLAWQKRHRGGGVKRTKQEAAL